MPKKKTSTQRKKSLTYDKQALKISHICSIIGYITLVFPLFTALYLIISKLTGHHIYLSSIMGRILLAGLIAGPILLLISLVSGVILFSQTRFIKSKKKKKQYVITAIAIIIIAALLAFYIHSFINSIVQKKRIPVNGKILLTTGPTTRQYGTVPRPLRES